MRRCLQKGSCDGFVLLSKDVSSLDPHGAMSFGARRCLQKGSCDGFVLLSKDVSSLDPHGAMSFGALRGVANSFPCRLHGVVLLENHNPKKSRSCWETQNDKTRAKPNQFPWQAQCKRHVHQSC